MLGPECVETVSAAGSSWSFPAGSQAPCGAAVCVVTLTLASGLDTLFWRHSSARSKSEHSESVSHNSFSKVDLMYGGLKCVSFLIKGNQCKILLDDCAVSGSMGLGVRPFSDGVSGIYCRNTSKYFLKVSFETCEIFLIEAGRLFQRRGPCT